MTTATMCLAVKQQCKHLWCFSIRWPHGWWNRQLAEEEDWPPSHHPGDSRCCQGHDREDRCCRHWLLQGTLFCRNLLMFFARM